MQHRPALRLLVLLTWASSVALACGEPTAERAGGPADATRATDGVARQVDQVLAVEDAMLRASEFAALLNGLDAEALPEVRRALTDNSVDSHNGDIELLLFATWWAGFDAEGALGWAGRDWRAPSGATTAVFRSWARRDPKAAWHAISNVRPDFRNDAQRAIIGSWYRSDPADLQAFVLVLPKGELQQRAMEVLAMERTKELGAEAALQWADGLEEANFRDQMRKRVAGAAGLLDPEAAAAWATPQIDDGPRTNGLARRIATRWVLSDPEAAMAWLSTLPTGGTQADGVLEAYRDWLGLSPVEAVRWIHGREVEPWLEPALALYSRAALGRGEPETAFALVAQFEDERLRDSTWVYIARKWLRRDRAAADAWLQQSDLPEGVKKRAHMIPSNEVLEERAARRNLEREHGLPPMGDS